MGVVNNIVLSVTGNYTTVTGTGCPGPVAVSIQKISALCLRKLTERTHRAIANRHSDTVGLLVISVCRVQQIILAGLLVINHIGSFVGTALIEGNVLLPIQFQAIHGCECLNLGVIRCIIIMQCHDINAGFGNCLFLAQVMTEIYIFLAADRIDKGVQVNNLHIAICFTFIKRMAWIHFGEIESRLISHDLLFLVNHHRLFAKILVILHERTCRRFRYRNVTKEIQSRCKARIVPVSSVEHIVELAFLVIDDFRCPVVGECIGHSCKAGSFIV